MRFVFGTRKRIKDLENRVRKLEMMATVNSYLYGKVTLQDVVRIIEKIPPDKPTAKK